MMDRLTLHARGIVTQCKISNPLVSEYAVRILSYLLSKPKCDVPNIDVLPKLLQMQPAPFELALDALSAHKIITVYQWEDDTYGPGKGNTKSLKERES